MAPQTIQKKPDTALQNHIRPFEDPRMPGFVTTEQSIKTLENMGVSPGWAKFIATVIVAGLGPKTAGGDKKQLAIDDVNSAKRPDSTQVFQPDGSFSRDRLTEIMTSFDKDHDNVLSLSEIHKMQFNIAKTPNGKATTKLEFGLLIAMFADARVQAPGGGTEPGLSLETLTRFYDGSLFTDALKPGGQVSLNVPLFKGELARALATQTEPLVKKAKETRSAAERVWAKLEQRVSDAFEQKVKNVFGAEMPKE